jgi:serine/threonine-protein kinase
VILYELLSGRPPFLAQRPSDLWHEIVEREAPQLSLLNPGAEPLLTRIAERLMRKDAGQRYQSASEVIDALEE